MEGKKDDILKKILQKVELNEPAVNFTESVMKGVRKKDSHEVVIDAGLKSLLKRTAIEKPGMDFTNDIMTRVKSLESKTAYSPVITRQVWRIIITVLICLALGVIFSDDTSRAPDSLASYFVRIGATLNTIFGNTNTLLYVISIFSIGILLVLDYLLKFKNEKAH